MPRSDTEDQYRNDIGQNSRIEHRKNKQHVDPIRENAQLNFAQHAINTGALACDMLETEKKYRIVIGIDRFSKKLYQAIPTKNLS